MEIRNSRDLRCAYESLNIWRELMAEAEDKQNKKIMDMIRNTEELWRGTAWFEMLSAEQDTFQKKMDRARERIRELKRDIRAYNNKETDGRYVIRNDWDSYVMVIPFPADWEREDVEDYYQTEEFMPRPNSIYDCTGQLFSAWHSIVRRAGRWYLYHSVQLDV